jgi:hypothetical protein
MSNNVNNVKSELSEVTNGDATNFGANSGRQGSSQSQEPTYSIQPHPAVCVYFSFPHLQLRADLRPLENQ